MVVHHTQGVSLQQEGGPATCHHRHPTQGTSWSQEDEFHRTHPYEVPELLRSQRLRLPGSGDRGRVGKTEALHGPHPVNLGLKLRGCLSHSELNPRNKGTENLKTKRREGPWEAAPARVAVAVALQGGCPCPIRPGDRGEVAGLAPASVTPTPRGRGPCPPGLP